MPDLGEALARMFDWFAENFKEQKSKSKSLQRSKDDFAQLLDDLSTRHNLSEDDLYDIGDGVRDILSKVQEIAYICGINDGVNLSTVIQSGGLSDAVLSLLDDLADGKEGGERHFSDTYMD